VRRFGLEVFRIEGLSRARSGATSGLAGGPVGDLASSGPTQPLGQAEECEPTWPSWGEDGCRRGASGWLPTVWD
jgi:hypothetical protein